MNALKNLAVIGLAALVGYVVWKIYGTVTSTASGISDGLTSVENDISDGVGAIKGFAANPLGNLFGGSGSSNSTSTPASTPDLSGTTSSSLVGGDTGLGDDLDTAWSVGSAILF